METRNKQYININLFERITVYSPVLWNEENLNWVRTVTLRLFNRKMGRKKSYFPEKGGGGNRISLWVKSWGLLREGIDRRWDTEESGVAYQILPTHIRSLTHTQNQSLLIKAVYSHTRNSTPHSWTSAFIQLLRLFIFCHPDTQYHNWVAVCKDFLSDATKQELTVRATANGFSH